MRLKALMGWGVGSFTSAALVGAVGLLHLRFMTDSLGLAIGVAGMLVVLSKIYDAAIDPMVGVLSDRTHTRWGRHRPYLVGGGLLAAVSLVMLFNVPMSLTGWGLRAWCCVSLLVFSTAYTLYRIPYLAIGRAITQDFHERSRLMTFSVYGSSFGTLAATSFTPWMLANLGSGRAAHGELALMLAALVGLGGFATFLLIDAQGERGDTAEVVGTGQHAGIGTAFAAMAGNRPFRSLILFKVTMFVGLALHGAAIPFYTRHVLHVSDKSLASFFLLQTLGMMLSQTGWVRLAGHIGRRRALSLATLAGAAMFLSWYLVPTGATAMPWVLVLGGAEGVAMGGLFFGLYTVLTDTMDHARRQIGPDGATGGSEGVLAGVFVMVEKATAALGTFIFSLIMASVGFVSARNAGSVQPAGVVTGIILSMSVLPALAAVAACLFLRAPREPELLLPESADMPAPAPAVPEGSTGGMGRVMAMLAVFVLVGVGAGLATPARAADAAAAAPSAGLVIPRISAGPDGKSRLDTVTLPRAPGADPQSINARLYTTDTEIGVTPPGLFIDWHRVSSARLLVVLSGTLEIGLGDGTVRRLHAGDMALAADTTGQGHTSRAVGDVPVMAMTVRLPREDPLRSRASSCSDGVAAKDCVANTLNISRDAPKAPH